MFKPLAKFRGNNLYFISVKTFINLKKMMQISEQIQADSVKMANEDEIPIVVQPGADSEGPQRTYNIDQSWRLAVFFGDESILDTNGGTQMSAYDIENTKNFKKFQENMNTPALNKPDVAANVDTATPSGNENVEQNEDDVVFVKEYKNTEENLEEEDKGDDIDKEEKVNENPAEDEATETKLPEVRRNPKRQVQMRTVPYDCFEILGWEGDDSIKYGKKRSFTKSGDNSLTNTAIAKKEPNKLVPQEIPAKIDKETTNIKKKPKFVARKRYPRRKNQANKDKPVEEPSTLTTSIHSTLHHVLIYTYQMLDYKKCGGDCDLNSVKELLENTCRLYFMIANVTQDDLCKYLESLVIRDDGMEYLQQFLKQ